MTINTRLSRHYHEIFYITDKNVHGLKCRTPHHEVLPSFGWWDSYNIYGLRDLTNPVESRFFMSITYSQYMLDVAWNIFQDSSLKR